MTDNKHFLQPLFLRSLIEICAVMGVGKETVLEWISAGAPIAVEMNGKRPRYSAEACTLQAWRVRNSQKKEP